MTVVVFNYATWVLRYPEFGAVSSGTAQLYFNEAQQFCDNSDCSPAPAGAPNFTRDTLLNMLTAHIAALAARSAAGNGVVGRIDAATQGSVNLHLAYEAPGSASWFTQTPYGAAFWQASAPYRLSVYAAPPCFPAPFGIGFPNGAGWGMW